MKKKAIKRGIIIRNILWSMLSLLLLLFVWYIAAVIKDNQFLLPKPDLVARECMVLFSERAFYIAFYQTFKRSIIALGLSFITALILAVFSVLYPRFYRVLAPIITIFRAVPTMSVIFLLLLVFSPLNAPIFVTFLVLMPSMFSMHISAFLATDKELIETGRVFGYSRLREVAGIHLPLSLPVLIESVASGFSLSLKILVAAEVLSSTAKSIGYLLTIANMNIEIARLFAITVVMIVTCIAVELALRLLNERIIKSLY